MAKSSKTLVVLSGGQDSVTCMHWAIRQWGKDNVSAISFDYGQKHRRELHQAKDITLKNDIKHMTVNMPHMEGSSPLTSSNELGKYDSADDLPGGVEPTFIPGRNIMFLALASNIAGAYNFVNIVTGVCDADYGGYPDCRSDFINVMQDAINLGLGVKGTDEQIIIYTPLMKRTKKQTVELAKELGEACWRDLAETHTCYDGNEIPCMKCHACHIRIRGFAEAGEWDPLLQKLDIPMPILNESITDKQ